MPDAISLCCTQYEPYVEDPREARERAKRKAQEGQESETSMRLPYRYRQNVQTKDRGMQAGFQMCVLSASARMLRIRRGNQKLVRRYTSSQVLKVCSQPRKEEGNGFRVYGLHSISFALGVWSACKCDDLQGK